MLPLRKAVEIAYKNIRMRLSRSLLVTSGIVLALSFLMSIQTNDAIVRGMQEWVQAANTADPVAMLDAEAAGLRESIQVLERGDAPPATAPSTSPARPNLADLRGRLTHMEADIARKSTTLNDLGQSLRGELARQQVELARLKSSIRPLAEALTQAARQPPKGAQAIDARKVFGAELVDIQKEVGVLPGAADSLAKALGSNQRLVGTMQQWIDLKRQQKKGEKQLNSAKELASTMEANGVPATLGAIEASRTQTRWLLGLALLVAFVGILNAMLMSVTERFREIGTMKCLGALDSFIVKLFLIESLFQGIIGTILGIALGLGLTLLSSLSSYGSFAFANMPVGNVVGAAGLVFVVGVALTVAGAVYPAWQAARMQPVEAMRVEA